MIMFPMDYNDMVMHVDLELGNTWNYILFNLITAQYESNLGVLYSVRMVWDVLKDDIFVFSSCKVRL